MVELDVNPTYDGIGAKTDQTSRATLCLVEGFRILMHIAVRSTSCVKPSQQSGIRSYRDVGPQKANSQTAVEVRCVSAIERISSRDAGNGSSLAFSSA